MTRIESPGKMTLQEIREAYDEVLRAYNDLFPLHPQKRTEHEETMENVGYVDIEFLKKLRTKGKEIIPKLKEAADQSGNPAIWRRGDPLEGLSLGMRERVERTLKFGI